MFSKVKVKNFDIQTFFFQSCISSSKKVGTSRQLQSRTRRGEMKRERRPWFQSAEWWWKTEPKMAFFLWSMMMISDDFIAVFPLEKWFVFYHNFFGHCTTKEKICGIFHPDVSSVNNFSKLISSFFTCFCIEWHWITSLPFHTFYREKTRWHDIVKSREKKRQITTFMWLLNCNKISAFLSWLNSSLFVEHTYKNPMSSWTPLFCFPTSFSWVYIQ